jgi:hypothetical protein
VRAVLRDDMYLFLERGRLNADVGTRG